ncbi:MAG: rubrerythrin family protein, partial [Mesorhizobium sp.]
MLSRVFGFGRRPFESLSEQEILALAISSEEDDGRIYRAYADGLADRFPHSARVFEEMAEEAYLFYVEAAKRTSDASTRKLLDNLAVAEQGHETLAQRLEQKHVPGAVKAEEAAVEQRQFILTYVQPGLAGLMDGSVSTLAPIFAAAFATHDTFQTFLVGLAASIGAGISMGFTEVASDDGKLSGRGSPVKRGITTGVMTALGGLGHALPYLIPYFWTATILAVVVV